MKFFTVFVLLIASVANATDYHVTTNAIAGGNGSSGSPWRLIDAITDNQVVSNPNHLLTGGDRILLHGGTYKGTAGFVSGIRVNSGVVTIQPYFLDGRPRIDGNYNGTGGSDNTLTFLGTNVVLRDIELFNSWPTRYTVNGRPSGIVIGDNAGPAVNIQIINCWIHDVGVGIFYGINNTNCGDYGNIQWNIGYQNSPPDRGHGHALYIQNGPNSTSIHKENSIWNTLDVGAQVFEQGGADVQNVQLEGNIVVNSGLINDTTLRTVNYVAYSTARPIKGLIADYNFSYHNPGPDTNSAYPANFQIGDTVENTDAVLTNNYFANGLWQVKNITNVTVLNNTSKTSDSGTKAAFTVPGAGTNSWTWNNNAYINPGNLFDFNGFPQTFASWKAVSGFDAGSTFSSSAPSANDIFVRTNSFSTNRANIIVYNWHNDDNVNVDLTGVCALGTFFKVVAGSDPLGTPVYYGMYYGGSITIPMTNISVATPVGGFAVAQPNPSKAFMNFIVLPAWTNAASSASLSDAQAAINLCSQGDVLTIPSGTATWTTNLAANGIHVFGAGVDVTKIIDEVPRTLANKQVFIFSGNNWQFGGLTVTGSLNVTTINFDGALKIGGGNWRVHDIKLVNLYAIGGVIKSRVGLLDHGTFNLPINEAFQVYDSDTTGYVSWNTDVLWGTTNFVRIQDNVFANNNAYPALDFYGGARVDVSHNIITNSSIGNHGTDSSQGIISCRAMNVHSNLFIFPPGTPSTPWPFAIYMRGGTARIWNNQFQGRYSTGTRSDIYRTYIHGEVQGSPNWVPWGGVTGSNPWDGNQNGTALGYPTLHMVGRGKGDLLSGNPPLNGGIATWTHDALDPVYSWSNTLAIDNTYSPNEMRSSQAVVAQDRDYFISTWSPDHASMELTYPDPLISGTPPSPPTQPPLPPSNLRIISVSMADGKIFLQWNASPTGTVNNYNLYIGQFSNTYVSSSPIGNNLTATVSGLDMTANHYFSVTATDNVTGLESSFSIEVLYTPPPVAQVYRTGNGNLFVSPLGFGQW